MEPLESGQIQPLGLSHAIGPPGWRPYFERGIPSILKRLQYPKPHHESLWWTFPLARPLALPLPPPWPPAAPAPWPPWPTRPICVFVGCCPSWPLGRPGLSSARLGVAGPGAAPGPSWPRQKWEFRAPALNLKGILGGSLCKLTAGGGKRNRNQFVIVFSRDCNLVSRRGYAAPSHPWECRGAILQRKYCRCAARRPKP